MRCEITDGWTHLRRMVTDVTAILACCPTMDERMMFQFLAISWLSAGVAAIPVCCPTFEDEDEELTLKGSDSRTDLLPVEKNEGITSVRLDNSFHIFLMAIDIAMLIFVIVKATKSIETAL
ncbi:hypothetical protein AKJ16_DCAP15961 [Drosera capensis]